MHFSHETGRNPQNYHPKILTREPWMWNYKGNLPLAEEVHKFQLHSLVIPPGAEVDSEPETLVILVKMPSHPWQIFRLNFADVVATLLIMILVSWQGQSVTHCTAARQRDI